MQTKLIGIGVLTLLVLAVAFTTGCYTVLKHPQQVSMADDHGGRRSCSDCHDQSYYYHDPYMYRYYDSYSYSDRWYGYYYDPWWYDDYWYYDGEDGGGIPLQRAGRTRWSDPARPNPPSRGATTTVGGSQSSEPSQQPQQGSSKPKSGSSSAGAKKRTRWGDEPARPTPPKKSGSGKKSDAKKQDEQKDG